MINYRLSAIQSLVPSAVVTILGDKVVWHDERTQPTEEDIVQKIAEIEYTEEVEEYKRVRELAYPSSGEQFDKIFHDGVDAWKAEIQVIKDAHPKAVIDADELASRQALALFNHQLKLYTNAQTRLALYQVALGRTEVTEDVVTGQEWDEDAQEIVDVTETQITVTAIDPVEATVEQTTYDADGVATTVTVTNPIITADVAERATAQAIVDATPQAVIDTYNGE
jgi:hypothetical protein